LYAGRSQPRPEARSAAATAEGDGVSISLTILPLMINVALAIQSDEFAQRRLAYVSLFLRERDGTPKRNNIAKKHSRAEQIHRAMLQVLDGERAGATQRALACALYGLTRLRGFEG